MAIEFTEGERALSYWLTGDDPPPINEDKVWGLSHVWRSHAQRLRDLRVRARAVVNAIRQSGFAGSRSGRSRRGWARSSMVKKLAGRVG